MELKKIQEKIKELENLQKSSDANESKQVNLIRKEFKEKIETLEKKRIAFQKKTHKMIQDAMKT